MKKEWERELYVRCFCDMNERSALAWFKTMRMEIERSERSSGKRMYPTCFLKAKRPQNVKYSF
jgi:hypothetical protein